MIMGMKNYRHRNFWEEVILMGSTLYFPVLMFFHLTNYSYPLDPVLIGCDDWNFYARQAVDI
jgi:hypothetical protein